MTPLNAQMTQRLRELESLFELLPVGVAIARDRDCREMVANSAFCRTLGIASETNPSKTGVQAARLPFRVVNEGAEVPGEDLPLQVAAREGVEVNSLCRIIRDDGITVILQGRSAPLFDDNGNSCGSIGIFVDVTERENLIRELQAARETIKSLRGMLSICAYCKKIRDGDNQWVQFEVYVRDHSEAEFTHSICPSCVEHGAFE
jgi:hypothetical protein